MTTRTSEGFWTAERWNAVLQMRDAGKTALEIAAELGTTRNAVLGACFRRGVSLPMTAEKRARCKPRARPHLVKDPRSRAEKLRPDHPMRRKRPLGSRAFSDDRIAFALAAVFAGMSHAKAGRLIGASAQSISRNWLRNPDLVAKGTHLFEMAKADAAARAIIARNEANKAAAAERRRVWENNRPILARMPPRHHAMMQRRIEGQTLQEIGDLYKVTRERVRQIEVRWRLQGLIIPGARPLNMEAAARLMRRLHVAAKDPAEVHAERAAARARAHALEVRANGGRGFQWQY